MSTVTTEDTALPFIDVQQVFQTCEHRAFDQTELQAVLQATQITARHSEPLSHTSGFGPRATVVAAARLDVGPGGR